MSDRRAAETAWERWADQELAAVDPELRARAVAAALASLEAGGAQPEAAAAARQAAGQPAGVQAAVASAQQLAAAADALAHAVPRGDLTPAAIQELGAQLAARRAAADAIVRAAYATAAPPPAGAPAATTPAPPPGPSLRELFTENGVLILGVTGAFLLVVATVLFELYGAVQLGGAVRFGAVAVLTAAFGLAGLACRRSVRLRVVGDVYLAVFALLVPLAFIAAYTFLELGARGITVATALGVAGLSCALLYSGLAVRMGATPYAWLAMAALLPGWGGIAYALLGRPWAGPATAAAMLVYTAITAAAPRRAATARFRLPALTFLHTAWVPGLAMAWPPGIFDSPTTSQNAALTTTLGLTGAAYGAHAALQRRAGWLLPAAAALTATVAWLDRWQGWGADPAAVQFVVLAGALVAVSWWPPVGPLSRQPLRVAAAFEIAIAAALQPAHAQVEALALLAATALLVTVALRERNPLWLAAATAVLAMTWYWLAAAFLPRPANPGPDTLAQLFAPLPALVGLAGIVLRRRYGQAWGYSLQAPAAVGGLLVAALAASTNDLRLAGVALLVYAAIAYLAGALEGSALELAGGLLAGAAGVALLLGARSSPPAAYVVAGAVAGVAAYATQQLWRRAPALALTHRIAGLLGLGLLVAGGLLAPGFYARHDPGDLAPVLAALALAAVLAAEARLHAQPLADYGAVAALGVAPVWVAGWWGTGDSIWFVAGPGLALVAAGLRMPFDRRLTRRPLLDRALVAAGAALLLGSEAYQVVQADSEAGPHLGRLLVGGVAAVLAGTATRSRTLVVAGSLAVLVAALRALFLVLESVQPYVLFGAVALVLLGGAAVLAALRERVGGARSALTSSWADWN